LPSRKPNARPSPRAGPSWTRPQCPSSRKQCGCGSDPARNLSQIRAADAPTGQALTATEHAACPGHAAYIDTDEVWAQDPDDNTTDTDELPQGITAQPRYVCTDPSRYRHLNLWAAAPADTGDPDPDDSDTDAITRQAEADARAKETARLQRALLIRLNKDADVLCTCQPASGRRLDTSPSEFVKVRMGPPTTLYWITRGGGEVVVRQVSMRLNSGAGGMGTLGADVDGRGGESADAGE